MSDIQIIKQLQNKNQQAIALILEKYGDALYGIIYREVKSESIAIKLMHTSCSEIWQHIQLYNSNKGQFFTWLVKIVYKVLNENAFFIKKNIPRLPTKLKVA